MDKVVNEPHFPPLHFLHLVLMEARFVRLYAWLEPTRGRGIISL
jgi:hypothetical protein